MSIAILKHIQANNVADGTAQTANTYVKRNLNTVDYDPDGIVSLSNSEFTLQAGKYFIEATMPQFYTTTFNITSHPTQSSRGRLYNVTTATAHTHGANHMSGRYASSTVAEGTIHLWVHAYVDIASATAFAVQARFPHNGEGARSHGYHTTMTGDTEIYTQVLIRKIAE